MAYLVPKLYLGTRLLLKLCFSSRVEATYSSLMKCNFADKCVLQVQLGNEGKELTSVADHVRELRARRHGCKDAEFSSHGKIELTKAQKSSA